MQYYILVLYLLGCLIKLVISIIYQYFFLGNIVCTIQEN